MNKNNIEIKIGVWVELQNGLVGVIKAVNTDGSIFIHDKLDGAPDVYIAHRNKIVDAAFDRNSLSCVNNPDEDNEILTNHMALVASLAKDPFEIAADIVRSGGAKANLIHAAIGISGEYIELLEGIRVDDPENILEEIGDILFYTGIIRNHFLHDVKATPNKVNSNFYQILDPLRREVIHLFDLIKKHTIYNQDLSKSDIIFSTSQLEAQLIALGKSFGFSEKFIRNHNILKLTMRYGEKYSDTSAQERADKA